MKIQRKLLTYLLVLSLLLSSFGLVQAAEVEVTVDKTNSVEQIGDTREYTIEYEVDVTYTQEPDPVGTVLVLDRSNSMLYTDKNGDPIAKTVWEAANDFVDKFYKLYPDGHLSIVSFGSNANKSDNWKAESDKQAALDEIEEIYSYVRPSTSNKYKDYQKYSYSWAWENWQLMDGGTNIASGFEYADKMINMPNAPEGNNTVILFTDGVATRGGKNYDKDTSPNGSHNTNTIAAYEAGRELQKSANVVTIGYFEGVTKSGEKKIAEQTLDYAQNTGFYSAGTLGDIENIFDDVAETLDHVGTEGKIIDVINEEFELIEDSVFPDASIEIVNGKTVITWELGTIKQNNYKVGYKVKVKDTAYQSGTGVTEVPINDGAEFKFNNLDDLEEVFDLGQNNAVIPSLYDGPEVQILVSYKDNKTDYLVGDTIEATHTLTLVNQSDYDYVQIDVEKMDKVLDQAIVDAFEITSHSDNSDWDIVGTTATLSINESVNAASPAALNWSKSQVLELKALIAGEFSFEHNVVFSMTNPFNVTDAMSSSFDSPDPIRVRDSAVTVQLLDERSDGVDGVTVSSGDISDETDNSGNATISGLPSGEHEIVIPLPSGYTVYEEDLPANTVYDGDNIVVTVDLDYNNATPTITIPIDEIKIEGMSISTLDGSHSIEVANKEVVVDGKIEFTTKSNFNYIRFEIEDDYVGDDFVFTFDRAVDSDGKDVPGTVVVVNNGVTFEHVWYDRYAKDTYTIYGTFSSPDNFGDEGSAYEVDVDSISTKTRSWSSTKTYTINGDGLAVSLPHVPIPLDENKPVIEIEMVSGSYDADNDTVAYVVTITDDNPIEDYKLESGNLDVQQMIAAVGIRPVDEDASDNVVVFTYVLPLNKVGAFLTGDFTVYAVDESDNKSTKYQKYEIPDLDIDIL